MASWGACARTLLSLFQLRATSRSIRHGGHAMADAPTTPVADATLRTRLADIAQHFDTLPDPRSAINRVHPLDSVIVIAILAILAGANGPTAIARWAEV